MDQLTTINSVEELHQFLVSSQRLDVKAVALSNLLGMTGNPHGVEILLQVPVIISDLFKITTDKKNLMLAKEAILTLINLTAVEKGAFGVWETSKSTNFSIVDEAASHISNPNSAFADPWLMVLSNITRVESLSYQVLAKLQSEEHYIKGLVKAFSRINFNKKGCNLHYLAPIFCNLTQTVGGRDLIVRAQHNLLGKIIPFTSYKGSLIRRGGAIGILKNVCFDLIFHEILLSEREDVLQAIIYPLCGSGEFTDEENDKLPIGCQYLEETKEREPDPDLRKMLLDSLLQLCATKRFRQFLRAKGVYEVLREYHKWEANVGKDKECLLACENVVDILIKKEYEIGFDNIKEVEVPEDVAARFLQEDADYLQEPL